MSVQEQAERRAETIHIPQFDGDVIRRILQSIQIEDDADLSKFIGAAIGNYIQFCKLQADGFEVMALHPEKQISIALGDTYPVRETPIQIVTKPQNAPADG